MALRLVEIILPESEKESFKKILENDAVIGFWKDTSGESGNLIKVLLPVGETESFLDELEKSCGHAEGFQAVILPVEATVPRYEVKKEEEDISPEEKKKALLRVSREELFSDIKDSMKFSRVYIAMVVLSTIVAANGLMRDNITIVIGAMVIAPLLGPNVAFAFATTLGDLKLGRDALKTNISGLLIALMLSIAFGYLINFNQYSSELLARTEISISDVALALASGVAGVLAFTSGASSALIGVMVAVALMPPLVTMGLFLGSGNYPLALGALLLLLTNVICLNLAGILTFLAQGIRPRTYWEAAKATRATRTAIILWAVLLIILIAVIYYARG